MARGPPRSTSPCHRPGVLSMVRVAVMAPTPRPPFDRLMANVSKPDGETGCWFSGLRPDSKGYAQVSESSSGHVRMLRGHRVTYEELIGPVPEGMELDHLCRVRACINPSHMEPVTHRENVMRGEGISASAAARTHCPSGHAYLPGLVSSRGTRYCPTCRKIWQARADAKRRPNGGVGRGWKALRTHCPHGHEFTETNTRINRDGSRSCRACHADATRQRRERRQGERT